MSRCMSRLSRCRKFIPVHPMKELLIICSNYIENSHNLNKVQKSELYSAIEICSKQNYFKFNDKTYRQLDGLPMGSPLSPLLSEIFMAFLQNKIFS